MTKREPLTVTNPSKVWVVAQLDRLTKEWETWQREAETWEVSPDYDPKTCAKSIMDGWANRRKHEVLREKTMVFISNNFSGYEFLFANWPSHPHEDNLSRVKVIAPGWLHRLNTMSACVEYARVTDGFWKEKGKQLAEQIVKVGAEKGSDIAASWLKNPMAP
jgi:hypothetical protein